MKIRFFAASAAVLAGLCCTGPLCAQAAPASPPDQAAPAAPADQAAPAFDPAKLIPGGSIAYLHLNEDAILTWVAQMKPTTLGAHIQALITEQQNKNPGMKNIGAIMALTKGFAHEAGIGIMTPANPAPKASPRIVAVIPILSMDEVRPEIDLVTRMAAGNGRVTWKDEPEGDFTVHVASGAAKAGDTEPAYAVGPQALIVGSDPEVVHAALKLVANPQNSVAGSKQLQTLAPQVDQGQALWAYINTEAVMAEANAAPAGPGPNPMKLPGFKELLGSYRGEVVSLALKPDRIELQGVVGFDPASDIGKVAGTLQPTPLKAPDLAFQQSAAFLDMADTPQLAVVYDTISKSVLGAIKMMAGPQGADPQVQSMVGRVADVISGIVDNCGNEFAIDVGPLDPARPFPKVMLMIQDGGKAGLQPAISDVLQGIKDLTGQKWFPKTILDTTIQVLGPAGSPLRPSFGKVGDFDILSIDEDGIKTPIYLAAGKGGGRSLSANPAFQHISQLLGPQAIGNEFINVQDIARFIMAKAPHAQIDKAKQRPGADIGFEILNDLRQVGAANVPTTSGFEGKMILTFDPNAPAPAQ